MGRYNVVVEDDEGVVWEKDEGGNVTHILLENDRDHIVASAIPPSFLQRPSLGSRSGSVPHSSSAASGPSNASSDLSEAIGGPSKLSKEHKDMLLEYLGIDINLPSLGPQGLCSAYQKFRMPLPRSWGWPKMLSGRHNLVTCIHGFPPSSTLSIFLLPNLSSTNSGNHYLHEHRNTQI